MGVSTGEQTIQMNDLNNFYRTHGFYKLRIASPKTQFLVDVINLP